MRLMKFPRTHISALLVVVALFAVSFAKGHSDNAFSNVKIRNFGQMDERFYRGAQPREEDYRDLASLGINTVIDLREDSESYEKRNVEALGMRYVNIPMSDKQYPKAEEINQFLNLVDDPSTGKFFVHCAGGRHRTGVMGAVYRFTHYQWNFEQVYAEMKEYDFYTRWGHGKMKDFVQDYWQQFQANQAAAATTATFAK
jgi:protein tyrosine/serine phosphatase